MGGPPGLLGPAANAPGQIVRSVQAAADAVGRPGSAPILAANLARDEHGAVIVRAELLAVGPDEASMQITERLGFTIVRRDSLGALGLATATLRVPEGMSAIDALALLRKADPKGIYDYAHVYNPSGGNSKNIAAAAASSSESSMAGAGLRVGMIDGGIDKRHPAFRNASLMTEAFAQHAAAQGTVHGTAVASLLVGHDGSFSGYLPGATLYAADVFAGAPDGGSADIIARALDWLAANNIAVTNISLAGPPNLLLEAAVKAFIARGHTLVAAAGNGGPAAPLNYPAAYPGVVAVTSVDSNRRPELDANRGAQFAALGVDVRAATLPDGYASVTGTSYAAPAVTARFALVLPSPDAAKAKLAINQLSQTAIPLGAMKNAPKYLDASTSMDSPAATSVGAR
jgi:subtilisin family serine protease